MARKTTNLFASAIDYKALHNATKGKTKREQIENIIAKIKY